MAQVCGRCGGVGRGKIEPGVGWVPGELDADGQPAPCPDCEARLEVIKKDPKALTVYDNDGKVQKKLDPETLTLGKYIEPPKPRKGLGITWHDEPGRSGDEPGAPAEQFFSPQQIQAQARKDR